MRNSRALLAIGLLVFGFGLFAPDLALAQEAADAETHEAVAAQTVLFDGIGLKGLGIGIGVGLVVMGGAAGIGRIGGSAVESMARQPESAGSINFAMIVTAAMIEGATLFAVVVCLLGIL